MPYRFFFDAHNEEEDEDIHFECLLQCNRCTARKVNGQRCSRRTCIGVPKCWQHLLAEYKIQIRPSTIPQAGKGVFAIDRTREIGEIVFPANTRILDFYHGELIDDAEFDARYGIHTSPYGIQLRRGETIDGACRRGVIALVNHKPSAQANTRFYSYRGEIRLKTTKPIRNGDELFANYGHLYQLHNPNQTHTTKPVRR